MESEKVIKKINNAEEKFKRRIPFADWLENPDAWDRKKFFDETAQFMHETYGISHPYNKNALAILADQMDMYIQCNRLLEGVDLVININGGKTLAQHPAITIRNNASALIIKFMKELGLTPNSHLTGSKANGEENIDDLLMGPKAA